METTLNKIKSFNPCQEGWQKLLKHLGKTAGDDSPLTIAEILKSNGVKDAVWALRTVEGHDREIRLFACDCAEMVLPIYEKGFPNDDRPRKAIEVSRLYADGKATMKELAAAEAAARDAAEDAAGDAVCAATCDAASTATWADIENLLKKYI
jgi:hypothetical protein